MSELFAGVVTITDPSGKPRVIMDGRYGTLLMKDAEGADTVWLDARYGLLDLGGAKNEGDLRIRDHNGQFVFKFDAHYAVLDVGGKGNEGDLRLQPVSVRHGHPDEVDHMHQSIRRRTRPYPVAFVN